jgi:hypothetical protein
MQNSDEINEWVHDFRAFSLPNCYVIFILGHSDWSQEDLKNVISPFCSALFVRKFSKFFKGFVIKTKN